MLEDEFRRLIRLFEEASAGKKVNLEEVFKESLAFFEHLKAEIAKGTPEDKQEAMRMMKELYQQMVAQTKKICETTGLSEEQLVAYAENPQNFTPDQWRAIQESKQKISRVSNELVQTIQSKESAAPESKSPIEIQPPTAKKRPGARRVDRSKWMRS